MTPVPSSSPLMFDWTKLCSLVPRPLASGLDSTTSACSAPSFSPPLCHHHFTHLLYSSNNSGSAMAIYQPIKDNKTGWFGTFQELSSHLCSALGSKQTKPKNLDMISVWFVLILQDCNMLYIIKYDIFDFNGERTMKLWTCFYHYPWCFHNPATLLSSSQCLCYEVFSKSRTLVVLQSSSSCIL